MACRWSTLLAGAVATACAAGILAACKGSTASGNGSRPALVTQNSSAAVTWQEAIEVAVGRANAGPWQMNESNFDYVDDPTVAINEDGSVGVAWCDNAQKDVFFQSYDRDGRPRMPAPINVSRSPTIFSWLPRLVLTDEQVFLLWQEIVFSGGSHGGEIFFSRSTDAGRSFSAPLNLSRSIGGDGKGRLNEQHWDNGSLDLARGVDGKLFAAWTEYGGALWISRSLDDGESFATPALVAGSNEQAARGPSLAATREALYLAWSAGEERAANIRLAVSRDAGQSFGPPRAVFSGASRSDAPKIAVDSKGVLHLAYTAEVSGVSRVHYSRSKGVDGVFETPRRLPAQRGEQAASFPSLSLGANGDVYVVWHHHPSADQGPRGLALSLSRDGGHQFSLAALVPGTADRGLGINGSRQGKLMRLLASNGSGAIAVVNSSFREGERSRVRLIRGRAQAH
jgi:hypothetical protein